MKGQGKEEKRKISIKCLLRMCSLALDIATTTNGTPNAKDQLVNTKLSQWFLQTYYLFWNMLVLILLIKDERERAREENVRFGVKITGRAE